jgi:hypothetical protein
VTRRTCARVGLAATLLLLAGCTPDGSPALSALPDPVPVASHTDDGTCDNGYDAGTVDGAQLVGVDAQPRSVVLLWYPGSSADDCRVRRTAGGTAVARRLAADIRSAPESFGNSSCPDDDGSVVSLYFTVDDKARPQRVDVRPSGCSSIVAPHRTARDAKPQLILDLARVAPSSWRARLQARVS